MVTAFIYGLSLPISIIEAPAPVTVLCAVGVLKLPYSRGNLYCLSAEQKCDDVTATALFHAPLSTSIEAILILRAIVEQAP